MSSETHHVGRKKNRSKYQERRENAKESPLRDPNVVILIVVAAVFLVLAPIVIWLFQNYS